MNRTFAATIALLLLGAAAGQESGSQDALKKAVASVSAEKMEEVLTELADDKYEGRNSGQKGNEKAADYIIGKLKAWGLEPFGDKRDDERIYRQHFEFGRGGAQVKTANIIARIEGTDEKLKHEIVVVGAHMDHVGRDGQPNPGRIGGPSEDDDIWNGADDNGSGTTTLLEVARVFAAEKVKTRRSVVFMWFSGEEWQLKGSQYYCAHPSAEIEDHVAMVNLDMVGRNPDRPVQINDLSTSDDWADLIDEAGREIDLEYTTTAGPSPGSDHASFRGAKVPAIHYFTNFHKDYHRRSDHADLIAYDRMAKIGQMVVLLTALLADREERITWREPGGARPARTRSKTLGIDGDAIEPDDTEDYDLPDGSGGIWVEKVAEGSVAEKAGIEVDDFLIGFNGVKLEQTSKVRDQLAALVRKAKVDTDIPVVVIRDGERKELKVRWTKKKGTNN